MKKILILISSILFLLVAIIISCSKTIILNKVEEEEERTETKADTTARDIPQMQEDTLHEITFQPMIEAWVISQGDTLEV